MTAMNPGVWQGTTTNLLALAHEIVPPPPEFIVSLILRRQELHEEMQRPLPANSSDQVTYLASLVGEAEAVNQLTLAWLLAYVPGCLLHRAARLSGEGG